MRKDKARKLLKEWLNEPLPNKTLQKRLCYRPSLKEVKETWRVLNACLFENKLNMPEFIIFQRNSTKMWACCEATELEPKPFKTKSNCEISLNSKWYCRQWFIDTLAHEMVHQYQWDIDGLTRVRQGKEPIMSHGPSFYKHRKSFSAYRQIYLKECHSTKKWFKHQSLSKC